MSATSKQPEGRSILDAITSIAVEGYASAGRGISDAVGLEGRDIEVAAEAVPPFRGSAPGLSEVATAASDALSPIEGRSRPRPDVDVTLPRGLDDFGR